MRLGAVRHKEAARELVHWFQNGVTEQSQHASVIAVADLKVAGATNDGNLAESRM